MSSLDKMWFSLISIGLMAVATFLISFARAKTRGIVRFALSALAVIALIYAVLTMLISLL
ncbi:DUF2768 family protein [Paenibacillus thermoaerophilus]|nr:DUF2768 family protein [Paenibacillus thermoaerophilus]TMV18873.1 DUF2768 family protein [Paenibacillus thermoaerophilus]